MLFYMPKASRTLIGEHHNSGMHGHKIISLLRLQQVLPTPFEQRVIVCVVIMCVYCVHSPTDRHAVTFFSV